MALNGNTATKEEQAPVAGSVAETLTGIKTALRLLDNRLDFIEGMTADSAELLNRRANGDPHTVTLLAVKSKLDGDVVRLLLAPHYYDRAWLIVQYSLHADFVILTDCTITITDDVFSTLFYNGIALGVQQ